MYVMILKLTPNTTVVRALLVFDVGVVSPAAV